MSMNQETHVLDDKHRRMLKTTFVKHVKRMDVC